MSEAAKRRIAAFLSQEYAGQIAVEALAPRSKLSNKAPKSKLHKTPSLVKKVKPKNTINYKTKQPKRSSMPGLVKKHKHIHHNHGGGGSSARRSSPFSVPKHANIRPSNVIINKKQREFWEGLTPERQQSYLNNHPDSIFHKIGVLRRNDKPQTKEDTKEAGSNAPANSTEHAGSPFKTRNMSEAEQRRAKRFVEALEAPDALKPNSEQREAAAGAIEHTGVDVLKENLSPENRKQLHHSLGGLFSNVWSHRKEKARMASDDIKDEDIENAENENEDEDDEDPDDRDERIERRKKYKNVAYVAGGLVCAALLGIGIAALISPQLSLVLGFQFLDKLPDILDTTLDAIASDAVQTADPEEDARLKRFVDAVANYTRDVELPKGTLDSLKQLAGE